MNVNSEEITPFSEENRHENAKKGREVKIAGYKLTFSIDQGDAWQNAADPKTYQIIAHRQCAWNTHELLVPDPDWENTEYINPDQANSYTCKICGKKLSQPAYFSLQRQK